MVRRHFCGLIQYRPGWIMGPLDKGNENPDQHDLESHDAVLCASSAFSSMPRVTSFFSMCRSKVCSRNFRRSVAEWVSAPEDWIADKGALSMRAASWRDSAHNSDDARRLCSGHIRPSARTWK